MLSGRSRRMVATRRGYHLAACSSTAAAGRVVIGHSSPPQLTPACVRITSQPPRGIAPADGVRDLRRTRPRAGRLRDRTLHGKPARCPGGDPPEALAVILAVILIDTGPLVALFLASLARAT
jgi:hypothetical protein